MTTRKPSRARAEMTELAKVIRDSGSLDAAILEMVNDARAAGVMDDAKHARIVARQGKADTIKPLSNCNGTQLHPYTLNHGLMVCH